MRGPFLVLADRKLVTRLSKGWSVEGLWVSEFKKYIFFHNFPNVYVLEEDWVIGGADRRFGANSEECEFGRFASQDMRCLGMESRLDGCDEE